MTGGLSRAIAFSSLDRYVSMALAVGTLAVMARILTPAETGLFLIAQSIVLLAENFRDFGAGAYLIQAPRLDRAMVRGAFTVTMGLSIAAGAAIAASAPAVAAFYGDEGLAGLLRIGAIGFLSAPFGMVLVSMLKRDFAFGALAAVNVAAAATTSAVTVGLGLAGLGAASCMWGLVAGGVALAAGAFAARPAAWAFRPSLAAARGLAAFGGISVATTVLNQAYELLPRLALGRILGAEAVGLYGRATSVCQLPDRVVVAALQPVVLPAFAARARSGASLRDAYLRGHAFMSAVQWPAFALLALLAEPVVRALLGPPWGEAAPLVRVMALANMAMAPAFMTYPVLVAAGRVRDTLVASLISLPPSAVLLVAAMPHGLDALAASLLLVLPLQMGVALLFVRRAIGLSWGAVARASARSLAATAGAAAAPAAILAAQPAGAPLGLAATAAAVAGAAAGWAAAIALARHPLGAAAAALARRGAAGLAARLPRGSAGIRG